MEISNWNVLRKKGIKLEGVLFKTLDFFVATGMTGLMILLLFLKKYFEPRFQRDFIFSNFLLIVIMTITLYFIFSLQGKLKLKLNTDKIILYSVILLFFVQIYIFYNIYFETGWDVDAVFTAIKDICNGDQVSNSTYFERCPNNILIVWFGVLILKINNAVGVFTGEYSNFCLVVVNCLVSSYASYLTYSIIKKILGRGYAFFGYIIYVGLIIFSPWNVIFYSDTIGLFFPIFILYIFLNENINVYVKYILILTMGYIGYNIKPQCIIVVIGILICLIIKNIGCCNKQMIKKSFLILFASLVLIFGISSSIKIFSETHGFVKDKSAEFEIPHFLMMGLNNETKGGYSSEDVEFSSSFSTRQEREEANLNVAKKRISDMGIKGMIHLMCDKTITNFNDGTFAWGVEGTFYYILKPHVNSTVSPILKGAYYSLFGDKENYYFRFYATVVQFIWISILFAIFYKTIKQLLKKDRNIDYTYEVIILALLGLTLFEMIFESRARYLYTYAPLFIIASMYGLRELHKDFKKVKSVLSRRSHRWKRTETGLRQ